ncbi:MAG: hypothetical protein ACLSGS_00255 [Adlercreutzia sp.]
MITQYVGWADGHGLRDLGGRGYNYFSYKDEEGRRPGGLAGMVGGGIMAATGGGAVMLSMS